MERDNGRDGPAQNSETGESRPVVEPSPNVGPWKQWNDGSHQHQVRQLQQEFNHGCKKCREMLSYRTED